MWTSECGINFVMWDHFLWLYFSLLYAIFYLKVSDRIEAVNDMQYLPICDIYSGQSHEKIPGFLRWCKTVND